MSFMHVFESGDFTPELTGVDDHGNEIRIMKVGGGTLGRSYGDGDGWEAWLVEITPFGAPGHAALPVRRTEVTSRFPKTHWDILLSAIEILDRTNV